MTGRESLSNKTRLKVIKQICFLLVGQGFPACHLAAANDTDTIRSIFPIG
jgi:hypothetical protein